ncbi:MAG: selenide, water dikinase SelD, partial [Mucinivorans sp.]
MKYDLLSLGVQGGCSAKIPAGVLDQLLSSLEIPSDRNVIINGKTHDDAGVYQLNKEQALIVTTDFFPPICSDPYEFGQIAAANSLSDVYAMGGRALLVLNLNMFPSAQLPMEVLAEILRGGQSKINEAGALTMGGHTIDDQTVKYGLAVVGLVAPDRVVGNHGAKVGDSLILTKPLGIGVAVAAHRMKMGGKESYRTAIENMKTLNNHGAEIMQRFDVCGATDITGFGLLGHARGMALASGVTLHI